MTTRPKNWSPMDALKGFEVQFSCFHRTGDAPWVGTVVLKNGFEVEIEELTNSWRVTPVDAGTSVTERSLERALLKAVA